MAAAEQARCPSPFERPSLVRQCAAVRRRGVFVKKNRDAGRPVGQVPQLVGEPWAIDSTVCFMNLVAPCAGLCTGVKRAGAHPSLARGSLIRDDWPVRRRCGAVTMSSRLVTAAFARAGTSSSPNSKHGSLSGALACRRPARRRLRLRLRLQHIGRHLDHHRIVRRPLAPRIAS